MPGLAPPPTGQPSSMTPDSSQLDPLAPIALVVVVLPFLAGALLDPPDLGWRLSAAVVGGGLGVTSLLRIRRSAGRLRGRRVALAAAVAGLGLSVLGLIVLAFALTIFVATGSA